MVLLLKLAWRNLWRNRRRTLLVVMAMGMMMSFLVMYDGMLFGFESAVYGNAIKLSGGNIQIRAVGYEDSISPNPMLPLGNGLDAVQAAESQPGVEAALRHASTGGLISNRTGAFSVSIFGIEPEKEAPLNPIFQEEFLLDGRLLKGDDEDVVFIGKGLADAMEVGVGDRVSMSGKSTNDEMRKRAMTVIGIYDINLASFERQGLYISLNEAQLLYDLGDEITEVILYTEITGKEAPIVEALNASITGYEITTWKTAIPELSSTVDMKNAVMTGFSAVLLGIAGIGIFNILLMAIYERTKEIGLLGAIGLKPRQITLLFLFEGIMIGLVGAVVGTIMGYLITSLLGIIGIDYGFAVDMVDYMALMGSHIYPVFDFDLTLQRAGMVAIISALAALYPAMEASRREPADALHHV
ncbi:MAG: ABC transporter permease [Anaerolineae bacterium]|jgi:ABC-type lipoprotein release transport system permease subunit|nr:ABC transporter permease [Anaerolineae bacterium]MBT4312092.1 ABC transporter permease [Anaerolineae bacterium]MBT4457143.1 ABC transporter permease [Anaerolineae bacterium]MBT4843100.1 ABC transporter permease [Anaerolineae bacterium]MBT6060968.1 ABC transporter permease [Anaerolineae bacterium]